MGIEQCRQGATGGVHARALEKATAFYGGIPGRGLPEKKPLSRKNDPQVMSGGGEGGTALMKYVLSVIKRKWSWGRVKSGRYQNHLSERGVGEKVRAGTLSITKGGESLSWGNGNETTA